MKAEILEKARLLLGTGIDENQFAFCAADVENYICAYCGVSAIPAGCETLAARMLAAAVDGSIGDGALRSVTRGDFSVSYEAGEREGLLDFDKRLIPFRRLRWEGQ